MNSSFKNKKFVLSLSTRTWIRDSHGLFDYEAMQTKNINAVLAETTQISRIEHDIRTLEINEHPQEKEEILFEVNNIGADTFELKNDVGILMQPTEKNINDLSNKIWYILRSENNEEPDIKKTVKNTNDDYYLCKNDIIKLGRVKYALNEIHIPSHSDSIDVINKTDDKTKYNIESLNVNSQSVFDFIFKVNPNTGTYHGGDDICKICYSNNDDVNNPMVHLCKCDGGLRLAHYSCIKEWMKTKLVIKENEAKTVKSYNFKSFNCEICKTPYPFKFKIGDNSRIYELIDIEKPETDYIILESLNQVKDNCNIKSIHIIKLLDKNITIGRGHESDIRINDISVSRLHALLKYDPLDGRLLLRDLKSKFGTLVLIKKPLPIKEKKIHLQIGRTYMEAKLITMAEFEKLRNEKKRKSKGMNLNKEQIKKSNSLFQGISSNNNGNTYYSNYFQPMRHNSTNIMHDNEGFHHNYAQNYREILEQLEGFNEIDLEMQNALAASLSLEHKESNDNNYENKNNNGNHDNMHNDNDLLHHH